MAEKVVEVIGSLGIVRDSPAHKITDSAFSDGKNILFGTDGAEVVAGNLPVFSTAPITPIWIQAFPTLIAPKWVYANLTDVYVFDGSSHTEITRISGDYAAVATERWQGSTFNGVGILNNTIDIPQAWTEFDPATKLVNLPNWPATRRAKSIRPFKNFLVALNLTDSSVHRPYRILWSDSAVPGSVPGSWDSTDPATDSREFDLAQTPDHLVDQLELGEINIIYKETSTWGMRFIGPPNFFAFWRILSNRGILTRDCVVSTPVGHVVVTQDDIIVHLGQTEQATSIIDKVLRKYIFSSIDPTSFYNSFLLSDVKKNEVYFFYPEVGQTYANKVLIWNWVDKSRALRDVPLTPFAAIGPVGDSLIEDVEWGV